MPTAFLLLITLLPLTHSIASPEACDKHQCEIFIDLSQQDENLISNYQSFGESYIPQRIWFELTTPTEVMTGALVLYQRAGIIKRSYTSAGFETLQRNKRVIFNCHGNIVYRRETFQGLCTFTPGHGSFFLFQGRFVTDKGTYDIQPGCSSNNDQLTLLGQCHTMLKLKTAEDVYSHEDFLDELEARMPPMPLHPFASIIPSIKR